MSNQVTLSSKTLIMLVGPSAVGKSALMNETTQQNSEFAYVRSFTTRSPRPGEQSHYNFIDRTTAKALHRTNQTVTYFEHPTTRDIYGTTLGSYPKKYNLLDTLSGSVTGYRSLPFEKTATIALTAPADDWHNWFTGRYPEPTAEATKRLEEAASSISWALNDPEVLWVVNQEGRLKETAQEIIAAALGQPQAGTAPDEPYAMLELINNGVWR